VRVYKPRYKPAGGKTRRAEVFWVDFQINGVRVRESLNTRDRQAAMTLALAKVKKADQRAAGIVTPFDDHQERPVAGHLQDFLTELQSRKVSAGHFADRERALRMYLESAKVTRLHDLDGPRAAAWLKTLSDRGLGARTVNRHRAALLQFSRWLTRNQRIAFDPFAIIRPLNEAVDRRYERRALTEAEVQRLVAAARQRPLEVARRDRVRVGVSPDEERRLRSLGEVRALIYAFAAGTGLRRGEMQGLQWMDLDLEGGHVRIPAPVAKSKKDQSIPLRRELAEWLRRFRWESISRKPSDRVFPPALFPQGRTVRKDFEAAGIQGTDEEGRVVDFHALRQTFITALAARGVHPRVAQALARHSSIELTLKVYTDLRLLDLRGAVEGLPSAGGTAGGTGADPTAQAAGGKGSRGTGGQGAAV
jgi:integrase